MPSLPSLGSNLSPPVISKTNSGWKLGTSNSSRSLKVNAGTRSSTDTSASSSNYTTDLCDAALTGDLDKVKQLTSKITIQEINTPNVRKQTALYCAVYGGHEEIVEHLLSFKNVDVNTQDIRGNTPLHIASFKSNSNILSLLLSYGADPSIRNKCSLKTNAPEPKTADEETSDSNSRVWIAFKTSGIDGLKFLGLNVIQQKAKEQKKETQEPKPSKTDSQASKSKSGPPNPKEETTNLPSVDTCYKCHLPITSEQVPITTLERYYHTNCFVCAECAVFIGDQPFFLLNNELYCSGCYSILSCV
eukprot:TRINITY_DN1281_c0_g1_i1.p1 TRINITY_DN1281_c0_g1~~TRINITY_DN1281_c0_g1_i1.p1  ORF type:complete len:303 (-),score=37.35 TRINITY_DN1281_c0_g1_i1:116-1024(-)